MPDPYQNTGVMQQRDAITAALMNIQNPPPQTPPPQMPQGMPPPMGGMPPSGPLGADYTMVSCNVGGEMQAQVSDFASNPAPLVLTYQAPAAPATISNTATASCTGGCAPAPTSTATAMVVAPTMTITKSGPPSIQPGGTLRCLCALGVPTCICAPT